MEAGEKKTEIEQTNGGIGMSSSSNSRVTAPTGSIISRPTRRISEEDSAVSWFLYCEQHEGSPRSTNKEVDVHRDDEEFGMVSFESEHSSLRSVWAYWYLQTIFSSPSLVMIKVYVLRVGMTLTL